MRFVFLIIVICSFSACDRTHSPKEPEPGLPFKSVPVPNDEGVWHILSLPDGDRLMVKTIPSETGTSIASVSLSQKGGIAFSSDYQENEYFYSSPPFSDFQIWVRSNDGKFVQASEKRHKQYTESAELIGSFFENTFGTGMSTEEAMQELKTLREKLKEIFEK